MYVRPKLTFVSFYFCFFFFLPLSLSLEPNLLQSYNVSGEEIQSTLQLVEIYFDTATFDDIERDKKIKTEAQLSLIGGTMGLLTGFSIISGIEIIFFVFRLPCCHPQTNQNRDQSQFSQYWSVIHFCRLVSSFRIFRADILSAAKSKFQNNLV